MEYYEDTYIDRYKPPKNEGRFRRHYYPEFRMTISAKPTLVFRGFVAINMERERGAR